MVVQPGERNAYDQQWLQLQLWEQHGVRTLRRTLAQVCVVHVWACTHVRQGEDIAGWRGWGWAWDDMGGALFMGTSLCAPLR